jgi:hypothetical protein
MSSPVVTALLVLSAALATAGAFMDSSTLVAVGGGVCTIAALEVSRRLWRWARSLSSRSPGRHRGEWELRPGYLVALLATAIILALIAIDAGEYLFALWTLPVAVAFLLLAIGRARVDVLLRDLLYPRGPTRI